MDSEQFDRFTRSLDSRFSRRGLSRLGLGGVAASALAALGLGAGDADAKKKKKKKKKKKNKNNPPPPPPLQPLVNTTCQNLNTACGNTAICVCALDKGSVQTCIDTANPPDGINFANRPCQQNINCGAGEVCVTGANVCARTCAN
jgi:hypothetical protein